MNKDEQLARLLRLKRHETPGDSYFEGFLDEFHAYQKKAAATPAPASAWLERLRGSLAIFRQPGMAWTAVAAYAGIMLLIQIWPVAQPAGEASASKSGSASGSSAPAGDRSSIVRESQAPGLPPQGWRKDIPESQTVNVSKTPDLVAPVPGKRRTADQPADPLIQESKDPEKPIEPPAVSPRKRAVVPASGQ